MIKLSINSQYDLCVCPKAEIERNGGRLPPPDPKVEKFDSNCITPGTGFMNRLAFALRFYVSERYGTVSVVLLD